MTLQRKSLTDILRAGNAGDWINNDWNGVAPAPEFAPLPPGTYVCHLIDKAFVTSNRGTPGAKLTFIVLEGDSKGRKLWYDIWLTDAAAPQARRDLAKLGIANKAQLEVSLPAHKRIRCELRVVTNTADNGDVFNKVRGFEVVGVDDVPPDPFAPPPTISPDAATPAASDPPVQENMLFDKPGEGNGAYGGDRL